ncbi:MAG: Asp-tRNA(Asn)/Glu-tRNA(Gln) amidotransferase subunit GatA [Dehalococcoidia bacterium]|nr:Asp-tRNA(Asn)/Glu-tRNA(Gln) amidotransferase subunit GatA [Dehalococcoidia bacterium]
MLNLNHLTIHEASHLLRSRQISSVELARTALDCAWRLEDKLHALVTLTEELALNQARKADFRLRDGNTTPLTGIPVVIKDNICTRGILTTCSSRMLQNFIPPYDATVMERLNSHGMVLIGKGNMDEFAMGSSNEHSAFGPTRNPWDLERVPGGSSGGPAASVAAGEALYALGSDTGGSIRQPAGFCSVVGLKPTYGRVSRYGLVAFASSLDQIGPLARDVTDAALIMNAIACHDPRDSTSVRRPTPDYTQSLIPEIRGLRLGVPREYFVEGMEEGVKQVIQAAICRLEEIGAAVEEVSLPSTKYGLSAYYIIAPSEASANLARYDGVKYGFSVQDAENMWDALEKTRQYGFGMEVKRRIMLGTYALSAGYYDAYYLKAQKVRTLIRREFNQAFERFDALITPTSPTVPFKIGEKMEDPMQMYLSDVCTLPVNIAGIPGISIPAGFVNGLPVGMQILAKPFAEEMLLRIAFAFERATPWHKRKPPI